MRSRVYETADRPSVCLSVPSFAAARHRGEFAAVGPAAWRHRSIAARGRRSAANASSVTLSADVGS